MSSTGTSFAFEEAGGAPSSSIISNAVVAAPSNRRVFPSPEDFIGADPYSDTTLFSRAPFIFPETYRNWELIDAYCNATYLPGNIPSFALETEDWKQHCVLPDSFLFVPSSQDIIAVRKRFAKLVYHKARRTIGRTPILEELHSDLWYFRTDGEVDYVHRLSAFKPSEHTMLGDEPTVANEALMLGVQIPSQFRYLHKGVHSHYWSKIRWERDARARTGLLVMYHNVEVDIIKARVRPRLYASLPAQWPLLEAPDGLRVELSPCVAYINSELLKFHRQSGLWVVVYTEFVAKSICAVLWEVYNTHRLFYLEPHIRRLAGRLSLDTVLGSKANKDEAKLLLDVINDMGCNAFHPTCFPVAHRRRSRVRPNHSPGRCHATCGDIIFYDPWTRAVVDAAQAELLCRDRRPMPLDHTTGYVYISEAESQVGDEVDAEKDAEEDGNEVGEVLPDVEDIPEDVRSALARIPYVRRSVRRSVRSLPRGDHSGLLHVIVDFLKDVGFHSTELEESYSDVRDFIRYCCNL